MFDVGLERLEKLERTLGMKILLKGELAHNWLLYETKYGI